MHFFCFVGVVVVVVVLIFSSSRFFCCFIVCFFAVQQNTIHFVDRLIAVFSPHLRAFFIVFIAYNSSILFSPHL